MTKLLQMLLRMDFSEKKKLKILLIVPFRQMSFCVMSFCENFMLADNHLQKLYEFLKLVYQLIIIYVEN